MRLGFLALLISITAHFGQSYAQSVSPLSLVGKWSVSDKLPNGQVMSVDLTLTQNMNFSGSATVEGNRFWDYSGSWELQGHQITWHYEHSSRPLPESMKTDVDDIISVDSRSLVLVSRLSGKRHEYSRRK